MTNTPTRPDAVPVVGASRLPVVAATLLPDDVRCYIASLEDIQYKSGFHNGQSSDPHQTKPEPAEVGKRRATLIAAITAALASAEAKGAREQREAREMLACKLAMTLKAYRRELPCGCADCAPAGGMHTNGGCRHSPLRSIIAYLTPPDGGAR